MFIPAGVSEDEFELHFAINHLAHAIIVQELLPVMEKTAQKPKSDVRVLFLTSTAWASHPRNGITFDTLKTPQKGFMGSMFRYGYANFHLSMKREKQVLIKTITIDKASSRTSSMLPSWRGDTRRIISSLSRSTQDQ